MSNAIPASFDNADYFGDPIPFGARSCVSCCESIGVRGFCGCSEEPDEARAWNLSRYAQFEVTRHLGILADQRVTLARLERLYVLSVIDACAGNKTQAADLLGIDRKTVYRVLKKPEEDEKPSRPIKLGSRGEDDGLQRSTAPRAQETLEETEGARLV